MHPLNLFVLVLAFISYGEVSAQPYKTLVAPINKHTVTSLYSITLNLHQHYVIDLNSPFSWFKCSLPLPPVACKSPPCAQAQSYLSPLCPPINKTTKNGQCTCTVTPVNPVTKSCSPSQLTYDNFAVSWTNGRNPTVSINFNHLYLSCAPVSLFQSLPKGTVGLASLSWSPLSLSSQFTPPFLGVAKKFAICLPSAPLAPGVIFFGDGPYYLLPPTNLNAETLLSYTPLLKTPKSPDYFIGVKAISINGKAIPLSTTYSSQRVKLSTVVPYTTLRSDLYKTFLNSFSKATKGVPRVETIKPFGLCLKASALGFTRVGFRVPQIDLQLSNGKNWAIFGANSMKQIGDADVACLAFVDGGKAANEAMVLGAFQMENNFLVFDLDQSRLGFSSTLFFARTTCGNFNFTTTS